MCDVKKFNFCHKAHHILLYYYPIGTNDRIPPACCVPTEFENLNILHFNSHSTSLLQHKAELSNQNSHNGPRQNFGETPVLRVYHNMIATSCGCR